MQQCVWSFRVVSLVAVNFFAATAAAQPHSLSDRVALLEERASDSKANIELINQLSALQAQVRSLQGQLEQLENSHQQSDALNARLTELEQRLRRIEMQALPAPVAIDPSRAPSVDSTRGGVSAQSPTLGPTVEPKTVLRDYQQAFDLLKKGQYADASDAFLAFLAHHPNASLTPNAMYWLGESYYATGNYQLAKTEFATLIKRYPTHFKSAGALLKLALSELQLGDKQAARSHLIQLISTHPQSEAAHLAQHQLDALDSHHQS